MEEQSSASKKKAIPNYHDFKLSESESSESSSRYTFALDRRIIPFTINWSYNIGVAQIEYLIIIAEVLVIRPVIYDSEIRLGHP